MNDHRSDHNDVESLVDLAAQGDSQSMAVLLDRYRERLERMVSLRLDRRLRGRVGASDVVQEAMIEASRRLSDYAESPPMGFFLWLRALTADRLLKAHRRHLGTQKRDAAKEISLRHRAMPDADSISLAEQLLGRMTSPTQAIARAERQLVVQEVLNRLEPVDREILVLRYFEQLSTSEAAQELGIKRSTAGKRYIAALRRLKQAMSAIPGFDQLSQ